MCTDDEESFLASVVFIKLPVPEIDGVGGRGGQRKETEGQGAVNPPGSTINRQECNKGGCGSPGQLRSQ